MKKIILSTITFINLFIFMIGVSSLDSINNHFSYIMILFSGVYLTLFIYINGGFYTPNKQNTHKDTQHHQYKYYYKRAS